MLGLGLSIPRTRGGAHNSGGTVPGVFDFDWVNSSFTGTQPTVTRASTGLVYASNGSLSSIAANTARTTYDEIFGTAAGLLVEKAITQAASSPTLAGAVVGTIGSGGSLPTGWTSTIPAGLALAVTAADSNSITIGLTGAATGSGTKKTFVFFGPNTAAVAAQNDVWTASAWVLENSASNITFRSIEQEEYNAAHSLLTRNELVVPFNTNVIFPVTYTLAFTANATTANTRAGLGFWCTALATVNASWTISRPQQEKSPYRTTFQNTSSRAADDVTLATAFGAAYSRAITWCNAKGKSDCSIWHASDGTANNYVALRKSGWDIYLTIVSGGITLTDTKVGCTSVITRNTVALAIDGIGWSASLNGKTAKTGSLTPPSGLNVEQFGGSAVYGYLNAQIERATGGITRPSDATLKTSSLRGLGIWDDFDYVDGPWTGTVPTGQTIVKVPLVGTNIDSTIVSGKLIADDGISKASSYDGIDLGSTPRLQSITYEWSTGAQNDADYVMIANPNCGNAIGCITNVSSVHNVWFLSANTLGVWETGALINIGAQGFTAELKDGSTVYSSAQCYVSGAIIGVASDGSMYRLQDSRFNTDSGRYTMWEHNGHIAPGQQGRWHAINALAS